MENRKGNFEYSLEENSGRNLESSIGKIPKEALNPVKKVYISMSEAAKNGF